MFLVFFDLPSQIGLYICMTNGERLDVLTAAITTQMTHHIIYIPCIPRFKKDIIYRVSMSKHISRNPSICYDYSHIIWSKKVIFGHDNKKFCYTFNFAPNDSKFGVQYRRSIIQKALKNSDSKIMTLNTPKLQKKSIIYI